MQSRSGALLVALLFSPLLGACDGGSSVADAGTDLAAADGASDLSSADLGSDAGAPDFGPPWPAELAPTSSYPMHRGLVDARAIIHLHSPISHDACDNMSWSGGPLTAPQQLCHDHLRAAVCATHLDFANLTDHAGHVGDLPFDQLFWQQTGDVPIHDPGTGELIGMQWQCEGGSMGPIVTVGSENARMPMGLHRHVLDPATHTADELRTAYGDGTPAGVAAFHAAGALVFQNHAEQETVDTLRSLGLDGMELYNLHANVDPRIRPMWLGLDVGGYLPTALMFADARRHLAPDLVFLAFFSENGPDFQKWNVLLSEGRHLVGIDGCDAHENALPQILSDGERMDSYRRMITWATNHELVTDRTIDGQAFALTHMRNYIAFEVYGSPVGFDFFADAPAADAGAASTFEMGDTAPLGATLHVVAPHLPAGFPATPAPEVSLHVYQADASGTPVEVATGSGAALDFTPTAAGAYYATVHIVPNHTRPYLGALADMLIKDVPWVYANPVFVGP